MIYKTIYIYYLNKLHDLFKKYLTKTTHKFNIFNYHIINYSKITPNPFRLNLFDLENNNLLLSSLMTSDSILKKDFRSLTFLT